MGDDELLRHLDEYLEPPTDPSPQMAGIKIVWERESSKFGARHIREHHGITEDEVEEVLFEVPPYVEARRHRDHPNRTVFWGATRNDRWLFVVCEDWKEGNIRYLTPITAFEPVEGRAYWETYR